MNFSPSSQAISICTSDPSGVAPDLNTPETGNRIISNRPLHEVDGATVHGCEMGGRPANAVYGIEPVDGWWLVYDDGDTPNLRPSWAAREYAAVRGAERRSLGVSRYFFEPTQDRFAWLVRNGFPSMLVRAGGVATPLTDDDIDAMLVAPGGEA